LPRHITEDNAAVETFSSYTRGSSTAWTSRGDRIDGIPPAIAIDQTNPVRTSRSTVGTMTEINDHLKLLFARASELSCGTCGRTVRRDTPESIADQLPRSGRLLLTFPITVPDNFSEEEVKELLAKQGYTRIHRQEAKKLEVIQDRIAAGSASRARIVEDLEAALKYGQGRVSAYALDDHGEAGGELRFSSDSCAFHITTRTRPRTSSPSTRPLARARPAAASAGRSASTGTSSSPMTRKPSPAAP
jgi:excinuclease ABC subunit A